MQKKLKYEKLYFEFLSNSIQFLIDNKLKIIII